MAVNGKRDLFNREDLIACARYAGLKRKREMTLLEKVIAGAGQWGQWEELAARAGVPGCDAERIASAYGLDWAQRE